MREINKKRVLISIALIIFSIILIIALANSRATQLLEVILKIEDVNVSVATQEVTLEAVLEEDNGYNITLPSIVNTKKVSEYYIEVKTISEGTTTNENTSENTTETTTEKQIKKAGEKLYLTEEEQTNKEIIIEAKYDTKTVNEKELYSTVIEEAIGNETIQITGYMPLDGQMLISERDKVEVAEIAQEYITENTSVQLAYDIKIQEGEIAYQPKDYSEQLEIVVTGTDTILETNTYKILHIDDENNIQEISEIVVKDSKVTFNVDTFSTYVLLAQTTEETNPGESGIEGADVEDGSRAAIIQTETAWDGQTIATKFSWGSGSEGAPYLIADGSELAYLAQQVANGTTYEGQYFQLASDIDLGNKEWTPIGTTNNSFRGIFDGAGHAIANARITISTLPTTTYDSYGIFASIGGGSTRTIIRNVEFSTININMTVSGTTSTSGSQGLHIGCVTGSMYRNASILNTMVKASNITDTNTITLYNSGFQLAVGGIAGYVTNTATSNTDPGSGLRYEIQNCYSNVIIQLDAGTNFSTNRFNRRNGRAYYHTGGIVGTIRAQAVWPSNCLYQGQITSEGFIGPIFAALVNNTDPSSYTNMNTSWQGNDAGNLTLQNGYYTEFAAHGTTYTATITTGTSSTRRSTSDSNVGYIQGVNKGSYTSDKSTLLSMFNGNVTDSNKYLTWEYQNETFVFKERFTTKLNEPYPYTYEITIDDPYGIGTYTLRWYVDGVEDTSIQGTSYTWEPTYEKDQEMLVVTSDGNYFAITKFTIEKIRVDIAFNINRTNNSVIAVLQGEGLQYTTVADYSFQWYKYDLSGEGGPIEGATELTLTGLEDGMDYKLVGTNNVISQLSTENIFTYGDRTVIYVDYNNGANSRDGFTPETAVETLSTAYSKLPSGGNRNTNVIVIMGTYSSYSFYESATATTYAKNATLTGKYQGTDYNARLYFYSGTGTYRYLAGDTTFQYMTFYGNNNQMYLYAQGHSVTMGEEITMNGYSTASPNQGLLGGNAPAFHLICGWIRYNYASLPRNNAEILIKSGTYGRIILGGSPGISSASNLNNTTSHNFMGSSMTDSFKIDLTIDIKNSTTPTQYDYDVNLIVGGSAAGNNYSRVTENVKSGTVGRLLGGSIGDSSYIKTNISNSWSWPTNTFLGEATINVTGGEIDELYGGCLGRNMQSNTNICDSYFYGTVNINIEDGIIQNNIYGAGAGGVTGYSVNSSDTYKSYGAPFDTSVNLNITGGTINGNIYGGGYGYTEYLQERTTAADSGTLYGTSNVNISGNVVINGNIYGAGCGYGISSKPNLAQLEGESNITITGNPTINGQIFGAGQGVSGYSEMAKLTGTANITLAATSNGTVYGGGNISKVEGLTNINVNSGTFTQDIYGGGNLGIITGDTNVTINGGTSQRIFGAGNQADVTNSIVTVNNGTINEIYAGGNQASVTTTKTYVKGGNVTTIYGGSNQTGNVQETYLETTGGTTGTIYGANNIGGTTNQTDLLINGGSITSALYGGGNQVNATRTELNLNKSDNVIPYIFGGGNQAGANSTQIYVNGILADKIFGGSNTAGTVPTSNLEINAGTINNIYGGNNQGGTTEQTHIIANGGVINNIFGGGEQAATTTSNINTTGGTITNIYGGGNEAGVNTSNIETAGGIITNVFGGSNTSGNVDATNITTTATTSQSAIENVYGGNNHGGKTNSANVNINSSDVVNVFGGGNEAVTTFTDVDLNGTVSGNVYGGGNLAEIETDTLVNITNGTVGKNVYGGGDEGKVLGSTYVHIKDATINDSLYAGGNGSSATVEGNTNLTMEGTDNKVTNNVFGGGNQAATGTETANNSISNVNIVAGTIGGNVYGGANTSVVYGTTKVNIGYDAVGDNTLELGKIDITGTVFGGGEANAAGDENYDFSFISVTNGIDIQIDGNGHSHMAIKGSIFGSGNASSTSGDSYITLKNYGTAANPQSNVSIQRATCATLINSAISLSGATDRTNEYSSTYFSLSRVNRVKMKNNSVLYLCNGANLLNNLDSLVDVNGIEQKGQVIINEETGETTSNVDNRVYMLEGKNLNVATNEQVTAYGQVTGMFFFGLFTNKTNPSTSTGFYNSGYHNGDEITNAGTFSLNSYAMAQHMENHDLKADGFYTNYNEDGVVRVNYIETTPKDDVYYIWLVGERMDVTTFEMALTASKYATLGTAELLLQGFSDPNLKMSITGFSAGLANGISLVDPSLINAIEPDETNANSIYGLTMRTGNNGWQTNGATTFLTNNGGSYTGNNDYDSDNSTYTPTFNFCFYHSENITLEQELGDVRIRLQVLTPVDDLNYRLSYIDINIRLSTALYQNDFYEAAITPGIQYGLFTSTETTITSKSAFSTYYSLFIDNFSEHRYKDDYKTYHRVIESRDENSMPYVLPENTKLTMLDMITNKYYYYIVTAQDVANGKYEYALAEFIAMGSNDEYFDEDAAVDQYLNEEQNLTYENFIFHTSFSESTLVEDIKNNTLLMELKDSENQTLIGVLGIQRDVILYTVYNNKDATIQVNATTDKDTIYLGESCNLNVRTNFTQTVVDSKIVYDTQYFDKKLGIKISIYDSNGIMLGSDSLLGITFVLDRQTYYPRIDGTTRISIATKVTDVLARIRIDTSNNKTLATGDYQIRVDSFGSADGIYYGLIESDYATTNIHIINLSYGLDVSTVDEAKIVDKDTGFTQAGDNRLFTTVNCTSALTDPNIAVSLYRRDYTEEFAQNYNLVDLKDYVQTTLTPTSREKEYVVTNNPISRSTFYLILNSNLITGTYKFVYKLYDENTYIGEAYEYMVIK